MVRPAAEYTGNTEIKGLDTPSLIGALELQGLNSGGCAVEDGSVPGAAISLEREVGCKGRTSPTFFITSQRSGAPLGGEARSALFQSYFDRWSPNAVKYIAAFNPLLADLNSAHQPTEIAYRKGVEIYLTNYYAKSNPMITAGEDGIAVLLKAFAQGGEASSIDGFGLRHPTQSAFTQLLLANNSYWAAISGSSLSASIDDAFADLGITADEFTINPNIGQEICARMGMLEMIAEGKITDCENSYNTAFDIRMISMFNALDDRQDDLLKWLVPKMFALYAPQQTEAAVALPPVQKQLQVKSTKPVQQQTKAPAKSAPIQPKQVVPVAAPQVDDDRPVNSFKQR